MELFQLLEVLDVLSVWWSKSDIYDLVKLFFVVIFKTGIFFKLT